NTAQDADRYDHRRHADDLHGREPLPEQEVGGHRRDDRELRGEHGGDRDPVASAPSEECEPAHLAGGSRYHERKRWASEPKLRAEHQRRRYGDHTEYTGRKQRPGHGERRADPP